MIFGIPIYYICKFWRPKVLTKILSISNFLGYTTTTTRMKSTTTTIFLRTKSTTKSKFLKALTDDGGHMKNSDDD